MNKETRIQKIGEITNRESFGRQEIPWEDRLESRDVYKIKLDYLVYNKYNGRILSRTKSLERQKQVIDPEKDDDKLLIEKLLWESKPDRNRQTLESIKKYGQEKPGIITKDGIIIDGNRRAMLAKMAGLDYFKAVVLPVTLEENPAEIEKLETIYQMGEDEKLGYNPIEKYLKAKGLHQRGITVEKIADWMGEQVSKVKEYLEVIETMEDYLDYLECDGIYTQLDGREDQFIYLTKWLKSFYGEESVKPFEGYRDSDVDDLKMIAFDYIRIQYEGKKFRYIADGLQENHFFGNKGIWEAFRDFHFSHIEAIRLNEEKINFDSDNLEAHLRDRDEKFFQKTKDQNDKSFLDENVDTHYQLLRYAQAAKEPSKLIVTAKKALDAIDQKHRTFSTPEVLNQVSSLNRMTIDMLKNKSPEKLLEQALYILSLVRPEKCTDEKEVVDKVTDIRKIAYQIEKDIKKSH